MKKRAVSVFALIGCAVYSGSACAEQADAFSLGAGVFRSSGTYGGTQSTDILYVPVTGKYRTKDWVFKLVVPYIRITGPGNVLNGVGLTGNANATTRSTHGGLGDVIAAATRKVYDGGTSGFMVSLTGKIKFGTASAAQGLGTGKNDYALQTNVAQALGRAMAFGSLGYRVYGSPAAYTLNNVFYGSVGALYKFVPDTSAGMLFDFRQKALAYGYPRREAMLFVNQTLDRQWQAQAYALKGFTNGSPDFGAGLSVTRLF